LFFNEIIYLALYLYSNDIVCKSSGSKIALRLDFVRFA
jgi:hypothetical protein